MRASFGREVFQASRSLKVPLASFRKFMRKVLWLPVFYLIWVLKQNCHYDGNNQCCNRRLVCRLLLRGEDGLLVKSQEIRGP